jgi:predicted membrane metal-binding protein
MGCLLALLLCAFLALWAFISLRATPTATVPSASDVRRARGIVDRDKRTGLIRQFTCIHKEASIDPGQWDLLHAEGKHGLAAALAAVCYGQESGYRMTLKDAQSARTLATFTSGRFEVK